MSRHLIPSKHPGYSVVIGWDVPLQTFFAHVKKDNPPDPDADVLCWLGATPGEFTDIEAVAETLEHYADIPTEMKATLTAERDKSPPPPPLQRFVAAELMGR